MAKDKGKGKVREGPYTHKWETGAGQRPWNVHNVPPPPLPPSSSTSANAPVTGQPSTTQQTFHRPYDPQPLTQADFPGAQWQTDDPLGDQR